MSWKIQPVIITLFIWFHFFKKQSINNDSNQENYEFELPTDKESIFVLGQLNVLTILSKQPGNEKLKIFLENTDEMVKWSEKNNKKFTVENWDVIKEKIANDNTNFLDYITFTNVLLITIISLLIINFNVLLGPIAYILSFFLIIVEYKSPNLGLLVFVLTSIYNDRNDWNRSKDSSFVIFMVFMMVMEGIWYLNIYL